MMASVSCAVVAAPLWLAQGGEPLANLLATSDEFRLKWAHFGGVYEPVLWAIESIRPAWESGRQEVLARHVAETRKQLSFLADRREEVYRELRRSP